MELWEKFQAELYDRLVIKNNDGFILYKKLENNEIYIHNIFVDKFKRQKDTAHNLEKALIDKEKPNKLYCYVDLTTNNPELSLKVILAAGYKILNSNENSIVLVKTLKV